MDEFHIPFTFWSFVVTSVFAVLCFFEPAFLLSISPLLLDESKKGKLSKVISLFLLLLVEKFKFMWEIQFILACSGITTGLLLLTLNFYLQLPVTLIMHPLSMLLAAVVFIFLEFLNIAITSAKMALTREISAVKDKMPVFLTLLRLSNSPISEQVIAIECRSIESACSAFNLRFGRFIAFCLLKPANLFSLSQYIL